MPTIEVLKLVLDIEQYRVAYIATPVLGAPSAYMRMLKYNNISAFANAQKTNPTSVAP